MFESIRFEERKIMKSEVMDFKMLDILDDSDCEIVLQVHNKIQQKAAE